MITFPSVAAFESARVYKDSSLRDIAYVDVLEPGYGDQAARWFLLPGEMAYLAGEVRFGPGPEGFPDTGDSFATQRLLPMPWSISPVYAWYREGERGRVVAEGKTSGFGSSNAIFNGTAPASALISPVCIGAELSCPAQVHARVKGSGDAGAVRAAMKARVEWDATLAEVAMARLQELLDQGVLTLEIDANGWDAAALDEVRTQVLLEWAHRLLPRDGAYPASALDEIRWQPAADLEIDWYPMDAATLRGIRVLRCAQLESFAAAMKRGEPLEH